MKTIGLIGGMSWESTAVYYRLLNTAVRTRLGGLHSARIALWSVDFAEIAPLQASGDWDALTREMIAAARRLEAAGAELVMIGANTMHRMAGEVQAAIGVPLVHIADAAAAALKAERSSRPLLLGTRFTMEQAFYRDRLAASGIDASVPGEADRAAVHRIIYDELCQGVVSPASKAELVRIVGAAVRDGADGLVLGCTELGLILAPEDAPVPVVDTAVAHCEQAVRLALA
jgi:aspartate racemase